VQSNGAATPAKVTRSRTVIGRQTGCQLRIRSGEVSREHCEVVLQEGSAVVRDKGSRNGTFVNGVKVVEKRLEAGDLLAVGPVVFLVQIAGQPAQYDAADLYEEGQPGGHPAPPARRAPASPDHDPTTDGIVSAIGGLGSDPDDSSVVDFEFSFDDDEEDQQPPL